MTHPEVQAQARTLYTLHDIKEEAKTTGSIVYVVRVGDQPTHHQVSDYLKHFRNTGAQVKKITGDLIQVGGVRIYFVSTRSPYWKQKIAGYTNFIDE